MIDIVTLVRVDFMDRERGQIIFPFGVYSRKVPSFRPQPLRSSPPNARNEKARSSLTGLFVF